MKDEEDAPRLRKILSENLRALIDDARETRPELGSIQKVADARAKHTNGSTRLSKSRIGRVVKGSHPTDIDALDELAEVFGLQPWQLLVEKLNPKELPRLDDGRLLERIQGLLLQNQVVATQPPSAAAANQPVERKLRGRAVTRETPALEEAFKAAQGGKKNARRTAGKAPKPKGRGRD